MQAQTKDTKSTWLTAPGGRVGCVQFQGIKKRLSEGQELHALVDNTLKEVIKKNNCAKAAAAHDSVSEEYLKNFNFETLSIMEERDNSRTKRQN